jgi:hypothetical protein
MTLTRTADATVRPMLTAMKATRWSWRVEDAGLLVTQLGWQLAGRADGGIDVELPWALPTRTTLLEPWPGGLSEVDVNLAACPDDTPETEAAADDAFADFVAIATEVLGPPAETSPGSEPSVLWRSAESTFRIDLFLSEVTLNWSSSAYQQFLNDTDVPNPESLEEGE